MNSSLALFATGVVVVAACTQNPSIDGTTVPKIGSSAAPPDCKDLCPRIAKLCGFAPQDCTVPDGGGYCDQYYDDTHRTCAGQAATCKELSECSNEVPDADSPDASDEDASDDASDDVTAEASTDAGKGDAKTD